MDRFLEARSTSSLLEMCFKHQVAIPGGPLDMLNFPIIGSAEYIFQTAKEMALVRSGAMSSCGGSVECPTQVFYGRDGGVDSYKSS